MIEHPHFNLILAIVLAGAILLTGFLMAVPQVGAAAATAAGQPDYVTRLFAEDQVISLDIRVDDSSWNAMLDQADQEQYILVDVMVNGTLFSSVGIRPKGNSSLKQSARSSGSRISFKIEFDHEVKGQTCFGLDKLVLNNTMSDATYMKDYLTYKMMAGLGVPSPLCSFASISVNGAPWGCYLAVESLEDSFAERVYGPDYDQLYNVKSMDGAGVLTADANGTSTAASAATADLQANQANRGAIGGIGGIGRMGVRSNGGDLAYTTDDPANYTAILGNAVFKPTTDDYQQVINALKNLSAGTNLEKYFNVDEILRYLAVHTFTVNLDSYSSNMQQNYYVYEEDGQLSILPWDYNLAYGGFQSGDASAAVNFPIDTPVSAVSLEARPLVAQLLAVEKYKTKYHAYLQELVDQWLLGGQFASTVEQADALIGNLVKNDPSAAYTYEQYQTALEHFKRFAQLRGQSIQGQLDGTIPATTAGQTANPGSLVDSSALSLAALGSQGFGGKGGNTAPQLPGNTNQNGGLPDRGQAALPGGGKVIIPGGNLPGNLPGGQANAPGSDIKGAIPGGGQAVLPGNEQNRIVPDTQAPALAPNLVQTNLIGSGVEAIVIGAAVVCLLVGLAFVIRFRRRKAYR